MLAFNPDQLIGGSFYQGQGGNGMSYCQNTGMTDSLCSNIRVPMISLSPVFYQTGDTIAKETYNIHISAANGQEAHIVRFEIYFNTNNVDAILATNSQCIGKDAYNSAGGQNCGVQTFYIDGTGMGPYSFLNYNHQPSIANFMRLASPGYGANATYTLPTNPPVLLSVPVELVDIESVTE